MGSISLDTHFTPVRKVDGLKDSSDVDQIANDGEKDLLLPPRKGGMSRHDDLRTDRKVQWNDRNGQSLVQVLEFDPSDQSDSEDEDLDSCICTIM